METGQEVLDAAARLIRRDGWTRYQDTNRGRHCVHAAIVEVTKGNELARGRALERLRNRLRRLGVGMSITEWNDTRGRGGRNEVIRTLERGD